MVLDRDYRDEQSVKHLEGRLNNRAMIWQFHEVENLLLNSLFILNVLHYNGQELYKTEFEVREALLDSAKSQKDLFVAQWAAYRTYSKLAPSDEQD